MKLCGFDVGLHQPFFLIAGTCSIEGLEMSIDVAGQLKEICTTLGIPLIYKGSFDKANRSSGETKRGVGIDAGLKILDEVRRQIHMIPEIRRFYSAFHEAWPYWFYFCNLDMDTLRAMTMCCMPSINVMQATGQVQVSVTCEPLDLLSFIKRDFLPMNLMCERAGMFEDRIYDRTKAVFEYFNLPFETEPPPVKRF